MPTRRVDFVLSDALTSIMLLMIQSSTEYAIRRVLRLSMPITRQTSAPCCVLLELMVSSTIRESGGRVFVSSSVLRINLLEMVTTSVLMIVDQGYLEMPC